MLNNPETRDQYNRWMEITREHKPIHTEVKNSDGWGLPTIYPGKSINLESANWMPLDNADWNISSYIHEESIMFYDFLIKQGYLRGVPFDAEGLIKRQRYFNEEVIHYSSYVVRQRSESLYKLQETTITSYLAYPEYMKWAYARSFLAWLYADFDYNFGHSYTAFIYYWEAMQDIAYRQNSFALPWNITDALRSSIEETETIMRKAKYYNSLRNTTVSKQPEKNIEQAKESIQPQNSPVKPSTSPAPVRSPVPESKPVGISRSPHQPNSFQGFPHPARSFQGFPSGGGTFQGL